MSKGFLETSIFLLERYRDINESLGHEHMLAFAYVCVWPAATKCEHSTESNLSHHEAETGHELLPKIR